MISNSVFLPKVVLVIHTVKYMLKSEYSNIDGIMNVYVSLKETM